MTTQNENVPALRFPEFNGDWEDLKVIDFAPLQRGFDLPVDNIVKGEYPVVFSNGILKSHNEFKAKAPGVVTGRSGTIGKVTYVEKDYWAHNTALWVTDFKGNHPKYVFYFYVNFKLERFGTGSGVPTLNRNDVHSQKIKIPTLPEQQKIAAFLTAVDEKIQQLAKKKDLLEQYKKGVMQKIFNQEIRFKDDNGNDFADWEEKKFGDFSVWASGGTPSKENPSYWNGEIPWISASSMRGLEYADSELKLTEEGLKNGSKLAPKGSLLILVRGSMLFKTIPVGIVARDVAFNQDVKSIKCSELATSKFILYWLLSIENKLLSMVSGTGIGAGKLELQELKDISIQLPSIPEQIKIVNFLSVINDKINSGNQQLEKTKEYKKGLLQQMFV